VESYDPHIWKTVLTAEERQQVNAARQKVGWKYNGGNRGRGKRGGKQGWAKREKNLNKKIKALQKANRKISAMYKKLHPSGSDDDDSDDDDHDSAGTAFWGRSSMERAKKKQKQNT
jgi:hypothetical protein